MASRRLILRGLAAAGLASLTAACGYRPLYGGGSRGGAVTAELAKVFVPPIAERWGQIMRNEMEHSIAAAGRNQPKIYTLDVALTRDSSRIGILKDATATRATIQLRANFRLVQGDKVLLQDRMTALAGYDILDNQYSTIVAEEAAEERAARDLADRLIQRVAAFLAERAPA